jgi:hypothetical protein
LFLQFPFTARVTCPGTHRVLVQLIDSAASSQVIHNWLVNLNVAKPTVSKTFDLTVPCSAPLRKKLKYANQYPMKKTFKLVCVLHWLAIHFCDLC